MKRLVPIIVTILICLFASGYAFVFFFASLGETVFVVKALSFAFCLIPLGIVIAMIYTLIERLKELKEEDNDDLSKY